MRKTVVINVVGLTRSLIGPQTPRLAALLESGSAASIAHVTPAVTCSAQATYLTGAWPAEHGIVGNGWYDRADSEIKFWKQSDALVQRPRVWEAGRARDAGFTCANLFWWYAMYSRADVTVTPRPMYPADGRKLPDVWTHPPQLRDTLQQQLGQFPLFNFWGPMASMKSTDWIAHAAVAVDRQYDPTLNLIYLPHLDYPLQKHGPNVQQIGGDLRAVDACVGRLVDYFTQKDAAVVVLSEYGIATVDRPVHVNRALREAGLLAVRGETGREILDAGASDAFAVADHQVAHVYVRDPARRPEVAKLLAAVPGVAAVLEDAGKREQHIDHHRAGDLVLLAERGAWFTYYFWLDDAKMPDYARTVDIHRKPGYDPVELFLDPRLSAPKLRVAAKLLRRKLGFRNLLDVIGTDASIVRGSHGIAPDSPDVGPLIIASSPAPLPSDVIAPTGVHDVILNCVFG